MTATVSYYDSPLGRVKLAARGDALVGLWFIGQRFEGAGLGAFIEGESRVLEECTEWLDIYFSGRWPEFTPKIEITGTRFRRRVLERLIQIPYGCTCSYREIAEDIGCSSYRAVGSAVAHNPISIIIACHRVAGSDGSLVGYAGGLDRKRYLLEMEKSRGPLS